MDEPEGIEEVPQPPPDIAAAWRETSAALLESERLYRELVENSLGLICIHDLSGEILSVNPAAAASLGYRAEEGIGRNLRDFLVPDKRPLFDDYLRRISEAGRDTGLMSVVSRSGEVRIWMYRNVLTRRREGPDYVLGHAIDVTDRVAAERALREREEALRAGHAELEARVKARTRELEQANERLRLEIAEREEAERARARALRAAEEANRLKDDFLGTLSHELRTPLNAIFGWARMLRARRLDAGTAHAVEVIERNAEAQIRLIEEVLDVSRIVAGKMPLSMEYVDVAAILRATVETVRPSIDAKGIHCEEQIESEAGTVFADPLRLQQAFGNVLSNALKFTAPGGTITVTLRTTAGVVEAAIIDTGIGIRRDVLPFVFDRFRQADSSMTRSYGGLGLGLAIARHVVDLHGGSVDAASAGEGQGATFTIRLPVADRREDSASAPPPTRAATASRSALRGRTVLVVEDHADARELICEVMRAAGADVAGAATTPEAVALARTAKPDLLIADLGLPGEDGFVLLRELRAFHPGMPAVALTAYARTTDRDRAIAAGFQRYVVKPIDPDTLVRIVEAIL